MLSLGINRGELRGNQLGKCPLKRSVCVSALTLLVRRLVRAIFRSEEWSAQLCLAFISDINPCPRPQQLISSLRLFPFRFDPGP